MTYTCQAAAVLNSFVTLHYAMQGKSALCPPLFTTKVFPIRFQMPSQLLAPQALCEQKSPRAALIISHY